VSKPPRSSWALRILRHMRAWGLLPLIENPERVILNFAFVVIGLSSLLVRKPGSLIDAWQWVGPVWSLAMIMGGGSVLLGLWLWKRSIERLGYLLLLPCLLIFAISSFFVFGFSAMTVGTIFFACAVSKAVRLLFTSAERDETLELGDLLKRNDNG
jgi:hypothetical protein